MSSALVWQVIRNNNSFLRKGLNGSLFSAEAGNLANKHSYKFSGLANPKTVDISLKGDDVTFSVARNKTAKQPKKSKYTCVIKKNARRALKSVGKQVGSYRADLKKAALGRLSALHKSLRVKKAAAK
eukprot:CAMPEP_0202894068 /NCGR_PEP_ID=MMETSP1392-20130828/3520_1 /ASSEMBLY_ACC=CAM_ASM_000868 /TAXON_ID=225041 /ORGANISM="Chlamydomonas chlamydogama, Strain SAG 11-48b" /LENGTH=126 /DNA_ID=CAMNT_0049578619 /DNA_START=75 /DNA_END=455 /DNA_ORIENTATION=+